MSPETLRQLRDRLGESQSGLARLLNVQRNTVWRWEAGMHPIPEWVGSWLVLYGAVG